MIEEEDIGVQRLTDFIAKSVTDVNDDHRVGALAAERSMELLGEMEICFGPAYRCVRRTQRRVGRRRPREVLGLRFEYSRTPAE